jgi:DNA-directed RNA polymerase specialized sigma24 family protein
VDGGDAMTPDVVARCSKVARQEAYRLRILGVPVDVEDVTQQAWVFLLEERQHETAGPLMRIWLRRRLLRHFVRDALAKKRHAEVVSIDARGFDGVAPSQEHEANARVLMAQIERRCPVPPRSRGSRQAKHKQFQRWVARARLAVGVA